MTPKLTVKGRIYSGFLTILGLVAAMATIGALGLAEIGTDFNSYRTINDNTMRVMSIDRNVVGLRRNVLLFVGSEGDEKALGRVRELQKQLASDLAAAISATANPERKAALERMKSAFEQYSANFDKIVTLRAENSRTFKDKMSPAGQEMRRRLGEVMDSAMASGDFPTAAYTGETQEQLLLARINATRFMVAPDNATADETNKLLGMAAEAAKSLLNHAKDPAARKAAEFVIQALPSYASDFNALAKGVFDLDRLVNGENAKLAGEFGDLATKVRGSQVETLNSLGTETTENISGQRTKSAVLSIAAVVLGLAFAFLMARSILGPINAMTGVMKDLASDNLSVQVPHTDRQDEIGAMATSVNHFKDQLLRVRQLEAEQAAQKKRAEAERLAAMRKMADTFQESVGKVIETVTSAATELQASSSQMSGTAAETSTQATTVAAAAQEASANVETVASATEELAASIREIAHQVDLSQNVSVRAGQEATSTTTQVRELSEKVGRIGEVVTLINDIASQTNLLALNATIEAARAGEAGKGFAVVAGEVKNLANQTARATSEIAAQIQAVQEGTGIAVQAIGSIAKVIGEMGEISSAVAAAVQQQTAATQEIARNVEQASSGTQEVSRNIVSVEQAARETGQASTQIKDSATDLSRQAEYLREEVARFLTQVRADKKEMKLLEWTSALTTGIASIDAYHRKLFDDVNTFYGEMMHGEGASAVSHLFTELDRDMPAHFAEEETLMSRHGYGAADEHRRSHKMFLDRIGELRTSVAAGNPDAAGKVFEFVANWLQRHLGEDDPKLAKFLRDKKVA